MIFCLFLLFYYTIVHATHFDGGSITWRPVNPYDNSSSVTITVIQSYWWIYPATKCSINVPITTSGRANQASNLTCVVDCSTDGGYSTKPITTLTDCTSVSSSLGMMTSQRSQNITLTAGAHFYLAYVGDAWSPIGNPPVVGLEWSITTSIDLRMRPDGFMNTPPVAGITSPQYIIANRTSEIRIPVSDANAGDDVRCRWAIYTSGHRRRREIDELINRESVTVTHKTLVSVNEHVFTRKARAIHCAGTCSTGCGFLCYCSCLSCQGTTCSGVLCSGLFGCGVGTTTVDTPGPLQTTSTYPVRQAINECGGICYPSSLPSNTTLSNCTVSIKGLVPNTWYAAAIQVSKICISFKLSHLSDHKQI